jgi:hypothetical protein
MEDWKKTDSLQALIDFFGEEFHEDHLLKMSEKDRDNEFNWAACRNLSNEPLMKNYYLNKMVECIRRKGSVFSYSKGIYYTAKINKTVLKEELKEEMVERHPIAGRMFMLITSFPPNLLFDNPYY